MSSGEMPIGTDKGKQPNPEALCQTPQGGGARPLPSDTAAQGGGGIGPAGILADPSTHPQTHPPICPIP